jgi:hypothetical protein
MNLKTLAQVTALGVALAAAAGGIMAPTLRAPAAVAAPAPMATSATKAADLRVALNNLLTEHVALAASATAGALGGRQAQFQYAAAELENNSNDITRAIASIYGEDAGRAFGPLWKKHIGFVVDYTTGVATNDKMKADKAVADLLAYSQEFGAFLNSATRGGLPTAAVADLVKMHIVTLKDVIDAQAAGNTAKVYADLRKAFGHMSMVADPLAEAIVKQFAARFAQ